MALQLRPNWEYCDRDLAPDATDAFICTYERTFYADCVAAIDNVCPNCGGGFAPARSGPSRVAAWSLAGEAPSLDGSRPSLLRP